MTSLLQHSRHRTSADDAIDPIAATPDWEEAKYTITVIDVDEFEAAHDDPEWLEYCQRADEYLEAVQAELSLTD